MHLFVSMNVFVFDSSFQEKMASIGPWSNLMQPYLKMSLMKRSIHASRKNGNVNDNAYQIMVQVITAKFMTMCIDEQNL